MEGVEKPTVLHLGPLHPVCEITDERFWSCWQCSSFTSTSRAFRVNGLCQRWNAVSWFEEGKMLERL